MGLTNEDVEEIIALLDDLRAGELHLRTRHYTLTLRRDGDGWAQSLSAGTASVERAEPAEPGDVPGLVSVRTPMAGTFYWAPKPGAPPFVEVGAAVEAETVVGIVETMKLMNSVYAGIRGRVAEICVANAALAAEGAVLMRIAPEE